MVTEALAASGAAGATDSSGTAAAAASRIAKTLATGGAHGVTVAAFALIASAATGNITLTNAQRFITNLPSLHLTLAIIVAAGGFIVTSALAKAGAGIVPGRVFGLARSIYPAATIKFMAG